MIKLHIANKNYSSWSMRPWVLMTELGIEFEEIMHTWGDDANWAEYRQLSPTGLVPTLQTEDQLIWDSLAIIEFLAESNPDVWPESSTARAWARSATAEMHSGFSTLRTMCSMSCGVRVKLFDTPDALLKDINRIDSLWQEGLQLFGGPYLGGERYTAVDAFYAPVVSRFNTYGIQLSQSSTDYMQRMLASSSLSAWYEQALAETSLEPHHETDISQYGETIADYRDAVQ